VIPVDQLWVNPDCGLKLVIGMKLKGIDSHGKRRNKCEMLLPVPQHYNENQKNLVCLICARFYYSAFPNSSGLLKNRILVANLFF
jgi:hypothetical protein